MNTSAHPSNAASSTAFQSQAGTTPSAGPGKDREQLEAKAQELRDQLASTLKQLGKRWHNLFNVREQLRRHPVAVVLSGTAVLLFASGGLTLRVMEHFRHRNFTYKFKKELRRAQRRLWAKLH